MEWSFRICKTNAIEAVAKRFYFATASILAGRKIVQIGQTEPVGVCPEAVHRYSEWFSLFKTQGNKKEEIRFSNFFLKIIIFLTLLIQSRD